MKKFLAILVLLTGCTVSPPGPSESARFARVSHPEIARMLPTDAFDVTELGNGWYRYLVVIDGTKLEMVVSTNGDYVTSHSIIWRNDGAN